MRLAQRVERSRRPTSTALRRLVRLLVLLVERAGFLGDFLGDFVARRASVATVVWHSVGSWARRGAASRETERAAREALHPTTWNNRSAYTTQAARHGTVFIGDLGAGVALLVAAIRAS